MKSLLIVLGNQLFDKNYHPNEVTDIFMCEDSNLFSCGKHHKKHTNKTNKIQDA